MAFFLLHALFVCPVAPQFRHFPFRSGLAFRASCIIGGNFPFLAPAAPPPPPPEAWPLALLWPPFSPGAIFCTEPPVLMGD